MSFWMLYPTASDMKVNLYTLHHLSCFLKQRWPPLLVLAAFFSCLSLEKYRGIAFSPINPDARAKMAVSSIRSVHRQALILDTMC